MNVIALKYQMRKFARTHVPPIPETPRMFMTPAWGVAAQKLAWRICGHSDKQAVYARLNPPTLRQEAVKLAAGELGVKESPAGSNSGVRVRAYQAMTGAYNSPWCASFASWAYVTAARKLGQRRPLLAPVPAYVPSWTQMIRSGSRGWHRVEAAAAMPGDLVTLWGSAHIEIVSGVDVHAHVLHTIGGNTSAHGQSSNGGQVCRGTRYFSEVTVVGRYK